MSANQLGQGTAAEKQEGRGQVFSGGKGAGTLLPFGGELRIIINVGRIGTDILRNAVWRGPSLVRSSALGCPEGPHGLSETAARQFQGLHS